jgi:hypothetical protein
VPAVGEAENRVARIFIDWLIEDGWAVREGRPDTEADVVAARAGESLLAELKSDTGDDMGTDVDTAFGQLLRRMPEHDDANVRYAIAVPGARADKVERVAARVLTGLRIEVYLVDETTRTVTRHHRVPR